MFDGAGLRRLRHAPRQKRNSLCGQSWVWSRAIAESLRELRQKREKADDWITYASWTAFGTAGFAMSAIVVWLLQGSTTIAEAAALIPGLIGQVIFGIRVRQRSFWAAAGLMTAYLYSAVVSSIAYRILTGLLIKVLLAAVYIRGFVAVDAYIEADKAIHLSSSAPASTATEP